MSEGKRSEAEFERAVAAMGLFQEMVEHLDGCVLLFDAIDERIIYVSRAFERIFGIRCESLYANKNAWKEVIHPDDREAVLTQLAAGSPHGEYDLEYRVRRPDGSVIWVSDRAYPVRDERGRLVRIAGYVEDITARRNAETALQLSEANYRDLMTNLPQIVWMTLWPSQGIVAVNRAFETLWGRPVDELLRNKATWLAGIHPEDRTHVLEMDRAASYPDGYETEYRVVRPDGTVRWVHDRAYPIRDARGEITRVVGLCDDITEKRALIEEAERARQVFVEGPAVVFRWNTAPGWPVEYVSENVRQFGYSAEEFTTGGRLYASIIHPDDLTWMPEVVAAKIAMGVERCGTPHRILAADGSVRWLEVHTLIRRDELGHATHLDGYVIDVTGRREAEAQWRESEEQFHQLFQIALDPIIIVDNAGQFVDANEAACALHQYSREELLAKNVAAFPVPPGAPTTWELFEEQRAKGKSVGRYTFLRPDGSVRTTEFSARAIGPNLHVCYLHDITETLESDRALREKEREARKAARARERLLDEVNHRVKNNLAGLISLVEMAERSAVTKTDLAGALVERLRAMHAAHVILSSEPGAAVTLAGLVEHLIQLTWRGGDADRRFRIAGPEVVIAPAQVGPLAMALNELLINSQKHGAQSCSDGITHITWSEVGRDNGVCRVRLAWQEEGGPSVPTPLNYGLGLSLISGFARFELRGSANFDFAEGGFRCVMEVGLTEEYAAGDEGETAKPTREAGITRHPRDGSVVGV